MQKPIVLIVINKIFTKIEIVDSIVNHFNNGNFFYKKLDFKNSIINILFFKQFSSFFLSVNKKKLKVWLSCEPFTYAILVKLFKAIHIL